VVPVGQDWAFHFEQRVMENFAALRQDMNTNVEAVRRDMTTSIAEVNANVQNLHQQFVIAFQLLNAMISNVQRESNANNAAFQLLNAMVANVQRESNTNIATLQQNMNANNTILMYHLLRNSNRSLLGDEEIIPIPNNQGQPPPPAIFPRFQSDIVFMEEADVNALLDFYNILAQQDDLNSKKRLLCRHIGIIRS
jgi:hypothetical protein